VANFLFVRKRRYKKFLLTRGDLESVKNGVLSETDLI
jgi:hypothetical protein